MVNHTSNIDSRLSQLFSLSECLDFEAGQRGSDNQVWRVIMHSYGSGGGYD